MDASVVDGIAVGSAGGAIAGFSVYVIQHLHNALMNCKEGKRVYEWLVEYSDEEEDQRFRSTRAIASYNNLTEDRVRYLCSRHKKIFLSTGEKEDMWGIHPRTRP